jgi:hypothetical protein
VVVIVVLTCGLVAGGCSSSGDSASSSASVCEARDHLTTSLNALRAVDVRAGGTNSVDAAVSGVKQALDELDAAAHSTYGDDVAGLRTSIEQLRTTVSTLQSGAPASATAAIATSIANVATAADSLVSKVSTAC